MLNSLSGDGIELVICPAEGLECVKADPGQIGQVVMNLVANARAAMPKGGKVVIETRNVTLESPLAEGDSSIPAGNYVMLSVADNGCGMNPDIVDHIFEPFFTTKEQGQGTGLGLATVYGIVKQSEGFIAAESEPGKGSTFKIYLPQVPDGRKKMVAEPEEQDAVSGSETILLAEDEPLLREIIRMQLEDGGYTVLEAHDGKEAMKVAASHNGDIDLLLTDVVMGGGTSGLELAASLNSTQPGLKILYMTGYTAELIDQNGAANLQDRVLQKPFTATRLKNKIREVLATR
jgi:CheY-like chemotaxis protein